MGNAKGNREYESDRGASADHALTYLECSNFKPAVDRFYLPMTTDQHIAPLALECSPSREIVPSGVVFAPKKRASESGAVFNFQEFTMSPQKRNAWGIRFSDAPPESVVAKVISVNVHRDGRSEPELPVKFYLPKEFSPSTGWIPMVGGNSIDASRTTRGGFQRVSKVIRGGRIFSDDGIKTPGVDGLAVAAVCVLQAISQVAWSVVVRAENGRSSLVMYADEDGVKGFHDLRTAPMAGGRRAALQHFVREHVRRPKNKTVREHFRGKTEFEWFGLQCTVFPPSRLAEKVAAG